MKWEKVTVFISSTFNDMHAERDYLVKKVFPRLSKWCEERKIRLVDIDLRWGVSEADATQNRALKICLDRIDESRPFFLCFLGQRRGWVPPDNVSLKTKELFPKLEGNYLGKNSVTEMEIIHAVIDPLHNGTFIDKEGNVKSGDAVKYAFFFLREPDYLKDLPHPDLGTIYTNDGEGPNSTVADEKLSHWRDVEIPKTKRPIKKYKARWCDDESTPEIALPYFVPTTAPQGSEVWKNAFQTWKNRWADANVAVNDSGEISDPVECVKAKEYNAKYTKSRLCDFKHENEELSEIIISQLKEAIEDRFGKRVVEKQTVLQKEIDQQEQFLRIASEGFIERKGDYDKLNSYISNNENSPLAITALPGMGKTSFLANWIDTYKFQGNETLHYRFIGVSDNTVNIERLLRSLLSELKEEGKIKSDIPIDSTNMINKFPHLLEEAGNTGKTIIIIDALDQLESGMSDLYWIPSQLPENVKLITSFRCGDEKAKSFYNKRKSGNDMIFNKIKPFEDFKDREKLVSAYLSQYFKELDEPRIKSLISQKGANNPLFLKVILSELRVFGVHDNLTQVIQKRFGKTPLSAFDALLERMENDPAYTKLKPNIALSHIFGWISHSRYGLTVEELADLFSHEKLVENETEALDVIHLIVRQLRGFLANREGKIDFFYESFKNAVLRRYAKNFTTNLKNYAIEEAYRKHPLAKDSNEWHESLAKYFEGLPLENNHKLQEQAFQYVHAGMNGEYESFIFDYLYIESCLNEFGSNNLIEDCSYSSNKSIKLLESFHRISQESLTQHPFQLPGELWGRMEDAKDEKFDKLLQQAIDVKKERKEIWLRPKFACLDRPKDNVVRVYKSDYDIGAIALSPDNKTMITAMGENGLAIWDIGLGKVLKTMSFDNGYPSQVIYSPNGKTFTVTFQGSGSFGKIKVFDAINHKWVCDLQAKLAWVSEGGEREHYGEPSQIAYTKDSQGIILNNKNERGIGIFDVFSGEIISSVDYNNDAYSYGVGNNIIAVGCFHPDRNEVFWNKEWFERESHPIDLFEYDNEKKVLTQKTTTLKGHDNSVKCIAVSNNDKLVASSDIDGNVKLWDISTKKLLSHVSRDKHGVSVIKFLDNGKKLAVGGSDRVLRIYTIPDLTLLNAIYPKIYIGQGFFFSDETHCIINSYGEGIKLISLENINSKNCCSEGLLSIGKNTEKNMIIASSYTNYIEPHKEPLLYYKPKGNIHFFSAENNSYLFSKPLFSVRNRDLVFVGFDGKSVFSKDVSYNKTNDAIFKYWSLDKISYEDKGIYGDNFILNHFGISSYEMSNRNVFFSDNGKYLVTLNYPKHGTVSIYKSKTGRLLSRFNLTPSYLSSLFHSVIFRMKIEKIRSYDPFCSGILSSGNRFFRLDGKLLHIYSVSKRKHIKIIQLNEEYEETLIVDEHRLFSYDDKLLIETAFGIVIFDILKKHVFFKLDRTKNKKGKDYADSNCFTSLNEDNSLLVISRAMYGGKLSQDNLKENSGFVRIESIQVWDIKKNFLISEFFIEGHVSNILINGLNFTFGLSNGEICTLFLENYY